MNDSYDWTEDSEYIIPSENIKKLREAVNELEFADKTPEAFQEFGDALYEQLEPIMDKLADWLEKYGSLFDEE